ncbi:MAG: S-layer homology domain-containing protein, partial [Acidimicrobiia bacterium]
HGVGMSQYGARALAEANGYAAEQITAYYYTGTSVQSIDTQVGADHFLRADPEPLWVGLLQDRTEMAFAAEDQAVDACILSTGGQPVCFPASNGETWSFEVVEGGCRFFKDGSAVGEVGQCSASIGHLQPDTRVSLPDTGRSYARGIIRLRSPLEGTFHVSLEIGLREYLYGLGEMPSSWHGNALRAQALAGLTYAVRRALFYGPEPQFGTSRREQCWCHLFHTVIDQNYVGWSKESETGGDRWMEAVDATAGRVITHPETNFFGTQVIQAFYFSSSGGATDNSQDVFVAAAPYLVSVDDPWSSHPAANNPFAFWVEEVAGGAVADAVGLDQVEQVAVTKRFVSGSAAEVTFSGLQGGKETSVVKSGTWTRSALGLRSHFIHRIFLPPFIDDDGSVHEADIATIAALGITKGCNPPANDRFCPKDPVSREQMAAFLTRMLGLPAASEDFFDDDAGNIFEEDINRLAASGITFGCAEGKFCPKDLVSREQMAAFLVRALDLPEASEDFFDDDQGNIFEEDINRLAASGITFGCDERKFCPKDEVTREQMASFLARSLALLP